MLDYQADSWPLGEIGQEIQFTFLISSPQNNTGKNYTFIYENIFESGKKYTLSVYWFCHTLIKGVLII
jgi:hypothetical protein